jgi:DNA-directed RNA polymerase specialized sigma24 family protein
VLSEDLVAEAFARAWAQRPKVRRLAEPRAWVIRVALNAHVSVWRRRRREVALGSDDTAAPAAGNPVLDGSLVAGVNVDLGWSWTVIPGKIPHGGRFVISGARSRAG